MNISEAITIYLKNYPRSNEEEFLSLVESEDIRNAVRAIIDETTAIPVDFGTKSLSEIGQEVENELHERHPELSDEAVTHLKNYFTYLVK